MGFEIFFSLRKNRDEVVIGYFGDVIFVFLNELNFRFLRILISNVFKEKNVFIGIFS